MKKGDVMPNGFVLGRGREPLNLTETQIRYAMKNSKSNSAAARFLNISLTTYAKYSKRYVDSESGLNLWDLHKNVGAKGIKKPHNITKGIYSIKDILDGKYPEYPVYQLKRRLINNSERVQFPHQCHNCGYNEKRITDGSIPLILDHMDGDWNNHKRDNLRFLCYNCFHNLRGNLRGKQPQWRMEQIEKANQTNKNRK
jgi:hypothetical protein